ncbi:helix-turn-helix transcriptional regulator [Streptacidiphilus anmyonensis]|uniref:helix-turn-helix transcriptional regulator n=1 Tax=Streptacidiphilus anmyonensis TaxID=405782 RepID=UPI0006935CE5|nr:helix-turn-helix transcriptional regulator [Streptacidiphilus anmyonensis]
MTPDDPLAPFARALGAHLASLRKARGLTQAQLADLAGITQAALSRAETGRTLPQLRTLMTIGQVLDRTVGIHLDGRLITGPRSAGRP